MVRARVGLEDMKKNAIAAMALACAFGGAAQAASYAPTYADDETINVIDLEGRKKTGEIIRAWEVRIRSAPESTEFLSEPYVRIFSLVEWNCAERTNRRSDYIYYGEGGKVLLSDSPGWAPWKAIAPSSVSDAIRHSVCEEDYPWGGVRFDTPDQVAKFYKGYLTVKRLEEKRRTKPPS
jgi:hypothetical protein